MISIKWKEKIHNFIVKLKKLYKQTKIRKSQDQIKFYVDVTIAYYQYIEDTERLSPQFKITAV